MQYVSVHKPQLWSEIGNWFFCSTSWVTPRMGGRTDRDQVVYCMRPIISNLVVEDGEDNVCLFRMHSELRIYILQRPTVFIHMSRRWDKMCV